MNAEVIQFLATAVLGVLRVHLPLDDLTRYFGSAFVRSSLEAGVELWKHGPLEITVTGRCVEGFKLNCLERAALPGVLQGVIVPSAETTLYEFIDELDDRKIVWEIDPSYSFDRQLCILTQAEVRAFFDLDHRELQSLQV